MTNRERISIDQLTDQLRAFGVKRGGVLLVHSAFSRIQPVENDMLGLIAALENALSDQGTLVMPTMSYDEDHVFDARKTPCREEMGIVPDTFWRLDGVRRSDSPHAFAARGFHAERITAPHPVEVPHGLNSPVGRVYELDGQVLLLGVSQGANTTIHLAENLAGVRYSHEASALVMRDGVPVCVHFREVNHCCKNFALVDGWLEARGMIAHGLIGHAKARLMRSRDIVETVLEHLRENETAFLHPYGHDEECDESHRSIETFSRD